jgi:hypothetical protein
MQELIETEILREIKSMSAKLEEMSVTQEEIKMKQSEAEVAFNGLDLKLNILFGGAASTVLLLSGIGALGKGLDAVDDITERISTDRQASKERRDKNK